MQADPISSVTVILCHQVSSMKPALRFKLLKFSLIFFSVVRLCIGIIMALLAIDHMKTTSNQESVDLVAEEMESPTSEYPDQHRSPTSFDIVLNGTDKRPEDFVFPEAALIASISIIILSVIGLIGLLKENIVWIVTFGLLSVLFLILRVHVLIRTMISDTCAPGEACIRDELLNTIIGIIEIVMIFRLAFELRLKRMSGSRDQGGECVPGPEDVCTDAHESHRSRRQEPD